MNSTDLMPVSEACKPVIMSPKKKRACLRVGTRKSWLNRVGHAPRHSLVTQWVFNDWCTAFCDPIGCLNRGYNSAFGGPIGSQNAALCISGDQ